MRGRILCLMALALCALPVSAGAQKLKAGTWTGTIKPPDADAIAATFEVRVAGDTTHLTLKTPMGELLASGIKVEAKRLLFTFSPGDATVRCTLLLQDDKSFAGDCLDSDGGKGVIVMIPPKSDNDAWDAQPARALDTRS